MNRTVEDWLPRHRITVHEYYRMGELGLFAPEARTELIEGEIIDATAPTIPSHRTLCSRSKSA